MSKKHFRLMLSAAILAVTATAFVWYLRHNPEVVRRLSDTPLVVIGLLLLLYVPWYLAVTWMMRSSLDIYKKRIPFQENFLLNAYAAVANFFGPGQSGPAVRGLYLKKRHGLKIRHYLFASLLYYAFFAVISAVFVGVGSQPWWLTVLFTIAAGAVSWLVIRQFARRAKKDDDGERARFTLFNLGGIFLATLLQLVLQVVIYFVELHSVNPDISWSQALTYTGVANFAMFVALTPGAIGIRESFLLFTGSLHHISNGDVVAASAIDRGVYLVFLGALALLVAGLHVKDRLKLKQLEAEVSESEK